MNLNTTLADLLKHDDIKGITFGRTKDGDLYVQVTQVIPNPEAPEDNFSNVVHQIVGGPPVDLVTRSVDICMRSRLIRGKRPDLNIT